MNINTIESLAAEVAQLRKDLEALRVERDNTLAQIVATVDMAQMDIYAIREIQKNHREEIEAIWRDLEN